jgi:hypothetical protein
MSDMFNVIDMEKTGEILCQCDDYLIAILIASGLRLRVPQQHFAVRRGDEIKFDTRNGSVEG